MKKTACVASILLALALGCMSENYLIHERIEEVIVEVPVYIETEVEVPSDMSDAEVWVDSFSQPNSVNGIDILWVIDTSGSMDDDVEALIAGISAMIMALPESGWRLALISNSPPQVVNEQQFPLVPGDNASDAEAMYNSMIVGHHEKGFDAAYEYIITNPYSRTWMRNDAALLVVFVSDEDDQSNTHFNAVADFTSWYGSLRTSVFLASIVNLDPAESLCSPRLNDVGERYIEATNHFAGVIVDICSEDWSPGVTDASNQVEPFESWALSHVPIETTIRVFIDTQLNNDWSYDASTNVVNFTVLPPAGSLVEIGYVIKPEPPDAGVGNDTGN